jgi:hypothetical protein
MMGFWFGVSLERNDTLLFLLDLRRAVFSRQAYSTSLRAFATDQSVAAISYCAAELNSDMGVP